MELDRFDFIGLDYYRLRLNHRRYAKNLRRFHRHGKPIVITEFGSGSYQGAAEKGPTSHDIIDTSGPIPRLNDNYVRDENVQAQQLSELLHIYKAEQCTARSSSSSSSPTTPTPKTHALMPTWPDTGS